MAFDGIAETFDQRFAGWRSVAAQRCAVRRYLMSSFPAGSMLLELGGGTGDDAIYLATKGYRVVVTDGAPNMVREASRKVALAGLEGRVEARLLELEGLGAFATARAARAYPPFDGVYSNFAALNCVADLAALRGPLHALVRSGGRLEVVLFGWCPIGEIALHLVKGEWRTAFRRFSTGPVRARVGGREFMVWYPRPGQVARALAPWFQLVGIRGIGIFVPPSAAEPAVSRFPRLVAALSRLDRAASRPFAALGDHVLLRFVHRSDP